MAEQRERLRNNALVLLGDHDARSDGQATFEKWPQAKRIRAQDRAYPFGCLVQQPTLVEAPAAAFKLPVEEPAQEHQSEIRDFLQVSHLLPLFPSIMLMCARPVQSSVLGLGTPSPLLLFATLSASMGTPSTVPTSGARITMPFLLGS